VRIASGLTAHADPGLARVLLANLIGNAWKFTGRRDDAIIEVGTATLDGTAAFFVRDNGAGFDVAHADKLFAPFQRLHSEREFSGTGIGLALAQRVVHRHGGRIWADAAPQKGATFFFTLPTA
jgi:light-regulated signal transduction histidine kinase (bacteriophytochrome)